MKNISSILLLKVFQKLLNVLSIVAFCSVGRTMYCRSYHVLSQFPLFLRPTEPLTNKIIKLCEFKFYRIVRVVADVGIGAQYPTPAVLPNPVRELGDI